MAETTTHDPAAELLRVDDLVVRYAQRRGGRPAVDGVSFTIRVGETVGLVGESGSGKSSIGKAVLGLVSPASGSVWFDGRTISTMRRSARAVLARDLQVVFQDPNSSLNPTRTIGSSLVEPLLAAKVQGRQEALRTARQRLQDVGLGIDAMARYPSAFSGGQRQRIAIARALVMNPKLIVCDEPVSALDLSVQAQVLNLLTDLQSGQRLSYLFITHDLSVVRHMSHRILVLQDGAIVEQGPSERIWWDPRSDYTRTLIAAIPNPDPSTGRRRGRTAARSAAAGVPAPRVRIAPPSGS